MIRIDFANYKQCLYAGARITYVDGTETRSAYVQHNPTFKGEVMIEDMDAFLFLVLHPEVYVM